MPGLALVQRSGESQGWNLSLSRLEPRGCRFELALSMGGASQQA